MDKFLPKSSRKYDSLFSTTLSVAAKLFSLFNPSIKNVQLFKIVYLEILNYFLSIMMGSALADCLSCC